MTDTIKGMNDGGPALPAMAFTEKQYQGMSLRDYLAAAALQGRLANPLLLQNMEDCQVPSERIPEAMAKHAYAFADAMLAERAKSTKEGA